MISLSVVIVNWNSGELLNKCVASVLDSANNSGIKTSVIIVDNNSTDKSLDSIYTNSMIKVLKLKKNYGFARACNFAVRNSEAQYILFLNPDASLNSNTLKAALDVISKTEIDVLGVKQIDKNGSIQKGCARRPTLLNFVFETIGISSFLPKIFKSYKMLDWDHSVSKEVYHVIGSFYLLERELFNKIGGFDERFFLYYEDYDLSTRINKDGGKVYYSSDIEVFHEGGGTSKKIKSKRLQYSLESRIRFSAKHFNFFSFFIISFSTFVIEPFFRIIKAIMKLKFSEIKEVVIAYKVFVKSILK